MISNDFDYENVDPETLKAWKREYRKKCWLEMRAYLKDFPEATSEERQDLREWVKSGHSPYENGDYVVTESGGPMDFINARRFLEDLYQEYQEDPEAFRNTSEDDTYTSLSTGPVSDLPF